MLFTLLAIVFSSFTHITNTNPRKRVRITKVQNPIQKTPTPSGQVGLIKFTPDGITSFHCISGFTYEVENATNYILKNVTLIVTQKNNPSFTKTIGLPNITPGMVGTCFFNVGNSSKSALFEVQVNVPTKTAGGQQFNDQFYNNVENCEVVDGVLDRKTVNL
jgi:hypothetical protein